MSKTDTPADGFDVPQQVTCGITDEKRKQQWYEIKEMLAERREVDIDDVSHADVARELLTVYDPNAEHQRRQFQRLKEDKRVKETRGHIADDHDVAPEDISLVDVLKITCSAYNGWRMTDDWDLSENGDSL